MGSRSGSGGTPSARPRPGRLRAAFATGGPRAIAVTPAFCCGAGLERSQHDVGPAWPHRAASRPPHPEQGGGEEREADGRSSERGARPPTGATAASHLDTDRLLKSVNRPSSARSSSSLVAEVERRSGPPSARRPRRRAARRRRAAAPARARGPPPASAGRPRGLLGRDGAAGLAPDQVEERRRTRRSCRQPPRSGAWHASVIRCRRGGRRTAVVGWRRLAAMAPPETATSRGGPTRAAGDRERAHDARSRRRCAVSRSKWAASPSPRRMIRSSRRRPSPSRPRWTERGARDEHAQLDELAGRHVESRRVACPAERDRRARRRCF